MTAAQKAIIFGASILLTIGLISLFLLTYSPAASASKEASNEFAGLQTELSEQSFLVYDHSKVSGSQVINAIRKFEGKEIGIKVETGKSDTSWYNYSFTEDFLGKATGNSENIINETSPAYINPSGNFNAKVVRDSNRVIRAIEFIQE
ncbi:hypothetical protein [Cytobacillus purgationiresistens]|uniref:ABC transporter permease n=1 Tax=Cytobacillus purgationiresistens TaxID=863449 RepID=A0ABU0AIX7_9BACI|nr:hypothetical protein [Cytobacillus purgationiresistens]MDQ0271216.1 hypothetical protein [Cytobacillus purgationiresistens]